MIQVLIDSRTNNTLILNNESMIFHEQLSKQNIIAEIFMRKEHINLNEPHSCEIKFVDDELIILGDEDFTSFKLIEIEPII